MSWTIDNEIQAWLKGGGSFSSGVDLYRRAGGESLLPEFHQAVQRDYIASSTYNKLCEALSALCNSKPAKNRSNRKIQSQENEPAEVLALRQRGRLLKKRESDVHGQMKALAIQDRSGIYEEQLYALAHEMMTEIQPALDETYDAIREWEQSGTLPIAGKAQIIQETVAKMRRLETCRSRCSRLRGWISKGVDDELLASYESELAEKSAEMDRIRTELNL